MLKPGEIRACLEEAFSAETGAPGICCHLRFGWKPGRTVWSIRCGKTGELTAEVNLRMTEGNRFSEPEEQMRYLRFLSRYGAGRLSGMARAQTAVPESYLEGLAILEDLETAERCCVLDLYLPGEKRPCGKFRFGPADLLAVMAAQRETGYKAVPEILCELPEICYTKPARPVSSLLWMLDAKAELTRKYPQAPVVQSLADGGNPFGAGVLLRMGGISGETCVKQAAEGFFKQASALMTMENSRSNWLLRDLCFAVEQTASGVRMQGVSGGIHPLLGE